ncbi:MAG TPA: hypothetical protein VF809_03610 [Candidatus Saccharimonadales bacterium]
MSIRQRHISALDLGPLAELYDCSVTIPEQQERRRTCQRVADALAGLPLIGIAQDYPIRVVSDPIGAYPDGMSLKLNQRQRRRITTTDLYPAGRRVQPEAATTEEAVYDVAIGRAGKDRLRCLGGLQVVSAPDGYSTLEHVSLNGNTEVYRPDRYEGLPLPAQTLVEMVDEYFAATEPYGLVELQG